MKAVYCVSSGSGGYMTLCHYGYLRPIRQPNNCCLYGIVLIVTNGTVKGKIQEILPVDLKNRRSW